MNPRVGNFAGFAACVLLLAYALYAQYGLGLEPCPLCIFQRIAMIALGIAFLIAAIHAPGNTGSRIYGMVIGIIGIIGLLVSARHIWVQAQPPGTVESCGASLGYLMEIMSVTAVIGKVLSGSGECARIDWTLLGLSMPWWVAFAFTALTLWALLSNFIARPRRLFS